MASIRKRGNRYQIRVCKGTDAAGKPMMESTTFTPDPEKTEKQNKKALDQFIIEFEKKCKEGKYLTGEKLSYKEYIDMWLEDYAKKQMEQTSFERCESSLRRIILPAIGHLKLSAIQPLHIQHLYDELEKSGYTINGNTKPYSSRTIKRIHQIISSSLTTAVYWQLIESNPCKRVRPPKVEKTPDVKHFTLEEAKSFLDYLDKPYTVEHGGRNKKDGSPSNKYIEEKKLPLQYKVFFNMALFGGFRRGELVALTWNDIDFENASISITKSSARVKNGVITKAPKTFSSNRVVTLPSECMSLLKRLQLEQMEYRLSLGSQWEGDNYVFIQQTGKQLDIHTPNRVFKKIIKRYNEDADNTEKLPDITLHGLRHTSATLLISQNIDIKTVSGRLGHSETSTTIDIYAHALKKRDEEASNSLEQLFKKQA